MTKFTIIIILFFTTITGTFFTCKKQQIYPNKPKIDFQQIIVKDSVDLLNNKVRVFSIYFKIIDGDGDFGIKDKDSLVQFYKDSTYANNFFATLFYLKKGVPTLYNMVLPLNGAIPYTPPVGLDKYFKALIIYNLSIPDIPDTLKLKFYVIDRHLNKSNEQETPWIPPDFSGTMADTVTVLPE